MEDYFIMGDSDPMATKMNQSHEKQTRTDERLGTTSGEMGALFQGLDDLITTTDDDTENSTESTNVSDDQEGDLDDEQGIEEQEEGSEEGSVDEENERNGEEESESEEGSVAEEDERNGEEESESEEGIVDEEENESEEGSIDEEERNGEEESEEESVDEEENESEVGSVDEEDERNSEEQNESEEGSYEGNNEEEEESGEDEEEKETAKEEKSGESRLPCFPDPILNQRLRKLSVNISDVLLISDRLIYIYKYIGQNFPNMHLDLANISHLLKDHMETSSRVSEFSFLIASGSFTTVIKLIKLRKAAADCSFIKITLLSYEVIPVLNHMICGCQNLALCCLNLLRVYLLDCVLSDYVIGEPKEPKQQVVEIVEKIHRFVFCYIRELQETQAKLIESCSAIKKFAIEWDENSVRNKHNTILEITPKAEIIVSKCIDYPSEYVTQELESIKRKLSKIKSIIKRIYEK